MNHKEIKFACFRFSTDKYKNYFVEIKDIFESKQAREPIKPKHRNDFNLQKKYYCFWRNCLTDKCENPLDICCTRYSGFIGCLGENEEEVKIAITKKRVMIPKMMDSSTDSNVESEDANKKVNKNGAKKVIQNQQGKKICEKYKHRKFIDSAPQLILDGEEEEISGDKDLQLILSSILSQQLLLQKNNPSLLSTDYVFDNQIRQQENTSKVVNNPNISKAVLLQKLDSMLKNIILTASDPGLNKVNRPLTPTKHLSKKTSISLAKSHPLLSITTNNSSCSTPANNFEHALSSLRTASISPIENTLASKKLLSSSNILNKSHTGLSSKSLSKNQNPSHSGPRFRTTSRFKSSSQPQKQLFSEMLSMTTDCFGSLSRAQSLPPLAPGSETMDHRISRTNIQSHSHHISTNRPRSKAVDRSCSNTADSSRSNLSHCSSFRSCNLSSSSSSHHSRSDLENRSHSNSFNTTLSDLGNHSRSKSRNDSGSRLGRHSRSKSPNASGSGLGRRSRSKSLNGSGSGLNRGSRSKSPNASGSGLGRRSRSKSLNGSGSGLGRGSLSKSPNGYGSQLGSRSSSRSPNSSGSELSRHSRSKSRNGSCSGVGHRSRSKSPTGSSSDLGSRSRSKSANGSGSRLGHRSRSKSPNDAGSGLGRRSNPNSRNGSGSGLGRRSRSNSRNASGSGSGHRSRLNCRNGSGSGLRHRSRFNSRNGSGSGLGRRSRNDPRNGSGSALGHRSRSNSRNGSGSRLGRRSRSNSRNDSGSELGNGSRSRSRSISQSGLSEDDDGDAVLPLIKRYKPRLYKEYMKGDQIIPYNDRYRRYEKLGDKIYLGLGIKIGKDSWKMTKNKNHTIFLRELSTIIWKKKIIANRCLDMRKLHTPQLPNRSPRKLFDPLKLELYLSLFKDYLENHHLYKKLSSRKKVALMRNATKRLSIHSRDERRLLTT